MQTYRVISTRLLYRPTASHRAIEWRVLSKADHAQPQEDRASQKPSSESRTLSLHSQFCFALSFANQAFLKTRRMRFPQMAVARSVRTATPAKKLIHKPPANLHSRPRATRLFPLRQGTTSTGLVLKRSARAVLFLPTPPMFSRGKAHTRSKRSQAVRLRNKSKLSLRMQADHKQIRVRRDVP